MLIDERFLDNDLRMQHREALHAIVAGVLASMTKQEISACAETCRIPLGVVQSLDEVLDDAHLAARAFFIEEQDVSGNTWLSPDLPFTLHEEAGDGE